MSDDRKSAKTGGDLKPGWDEIDPVTGQQRDHVVLSAEERAKGFVRPVRSKYLHLKCGAVTHMGQYIAETYARKPDYYGKTFCVACADYFLVGEFVWDGTNEKVGT